jgi:phosphoribosyl 1,2-cyclic phosphate phosphodiesterase
LKIKDLSLVVDCGPDFRQQMLRESIRSLDAILITHEHNDHVIGLDDVRPFNFMSGRNMEVYATGQVQDQLRQRFSYVFAINAYPGAPRIQFQTLDPKLPFQVGGVEILPVQYWHGRLPVLGFRIEDFAYLTDFKSIEPEELDKVKGLHTLIISALHHKPHHSHLNLEEALAMVRKIGPKRAFFTHMSHRMGFHQEIEKSLPEGVHLAFDGLRIQWD